MTVKLLVVLMMAIIGARAVCPSEGFMESLDLSKFSGTWYQYACYGTLLVKSMNRCSRSVYELQPDKKTIKMVNDFIIKGINNRIYSNWTATASDATKPTGKLSLEIKLPKQYGNIPVLGRTELPLMVLDTDYDNYAVLYTCKNLIISQFDFGFIFTRKRTYSEEELKPILASVDAALAKVALLRSAFTPTDQQNCDSASFDLHMATVGGTIVTVANNAAMLSKLAAFAGK